MHSNVWFEEYFNCKKSFDSQQEEDKDADEEEDEEEDMALLELRLIALASAVKKEGSAEAQEKPPSKEVTSNRKETPRKTSRGSERSTTRTSSGTNRQTKQTRGEIAQNIVLCGKFQVR